MRLVAVHDALYLSGEIAQENFHHRGTLRSAETNFPTPTNQ
jgi:hypothetical protein